VVDLKGFEMEQESCKSCKYWKEIGRRTFEKRVKKMAGQCRKLPPRMCPTALSTEREMIKYRFPLSAGDDWCGQYAKRPVTAVS